MIKWRLRKGPVILPLLLLVLSLSAYALLHFRGASVAGSLTLGQQYLNERNFGGAKIAFTRAIELDPNNIEARVRLAEAYRETGDFGFAVELLDDMVYTARPNAAAAKLMIALCRDSGNPSQALAIAQRMITATDDEDFYELRNALAADLYAVPRSFAEGSDHVLIIRDGEVQSRGANAFGQLGRALDTASSPVFRSADAPFQGTARKVACAGRTSLVLDQNGRLWSAGENRWGQTGEGYAEALPREGWRQILSPSRNVPIADAVGTTGHLLVLLRDGTLWSAGADSGQTLRQVTRFQNVISVASSRGQAAILTAEGMLYASSAQTPEVWTLQGREVSSFTLSDSGLCWVDRRGAVHMQGGRFPVPENWREENGALYPDMPVSKLARAGNVTLLLSGSGALYRLAGDGTVSVLGGLPPVADLYAQNARLLLELSDGSARFCDENSGTPQPLNLA